METKSIRDVSTKISGIELLVEKYRKIFRIPENINHYSEEDFRAAERKFLKWALNGGESNREQLLKLLAHL